MGLTSEELDYPSQQPANHLDSVKHQTSFILKSFISENMLCNILIVGENSEIKFQDFDNGKISWTIINLERNNIKEEQYKNLLEISGDIEKPDFIKSINLNRPTIVILSKPLNYLKEIVAKKFLKQICDYFDYCELIINFKTLLINKHSADQFSGVNKPVDLEAWNKKIFMYQDFIWNDSHYQKQYGVSLIKKIGHYKVG
ncbi:MAG: hypothetical protein KTR26_06645 [Flammeovirgaceae bacterium]|nr:hypothetical protein [Flammeovirgaceae bacterium]